MAGTTESQGLHLQQFHGRIVRLLAGAALGFIPDVAAKLVQRRLIRMGAGVAADARQIRDRGVELVTPGVLQSEKLRRTVPHVQGVEAAVAAHAMVLVHHRVVQAQFREMANDGIRIAGRLSAAPALSGALAIELRLGDDGNRRVTQ